MFLFVGFYPCRDCSIRDVLRLVLCLNAQSVTMHEAHQISMLETRNLKRLLKEIYQM